MTDLHTWTLVAVMAIVTALLRFLPFVIFRKDKSIPPLVEKLGRLLPYAIMGMLVVYCLKSVHFVSASGFVPEIISCLLVAVLYLWKRSSLLSIIVGTICYMILVQSGIFPG